MNIDIKKIENIKQDLQELKEDGALFIDEEGKTKYAIIPVEKYDHAEEVVALFNSFTSDGPTVRVSGIDPDELTYEEYERIKTFILEVFDKNFKPKAEKLN